MQAGAARRGHTGAGNFPAAKQPPLLGPSKVQIAQGTQHYAEPFLPSAQLPLLLLGQALHRADQAVPIPGLPLKCDFQFHAFFLL